MGSSILDESAALISPNTIELLSRLNVSDRVTCAMVLSGIIASIHGDVSAFLVGNTIHMGTFYSLGSEALANPALNIGNIYVFADELLNTITSGSSAELTITYVPIPPGSTMLECLIESDKKFNIEDDYSECIDLGRWAFSEHQSLDDAVKSVVIETAQRIGKVIKTF